MSKNTEQELFSDIEKTKGTTRKKILTSMYNEYMLISASNKYSDEYKNGYFASIHALVKACSDAKTTRDFNASLNYRVTSYSK
jgi:hypothetical protein